MSAHPALIFANDAFYRAFADRDIVAMAEVWAETDPVSCLHPGWAPLIGRDVVLASFKAILEGPAPPQIAPEAAEAAVHGDIGIVICYEAIAGDYLVATNVFRREGARWRLVHHQAGPVNDPPPEPDEPASPVN